MASITINKGADKKITVLATGDLTAEIVRIYFSVAKTPGADPVVHDKYSTDVADHPAYGVIDTVTYDALTDKSSIPINVFRTETINYPTKLLAVVIYALGADDDFPSGFRRIAQNEGEIIVNEILLPADLA